MENTETDVEMELTNTKTNPYKKRKYEAGYMSKIQLLEEHIVALQTGKQQESNKLYDIGIDLQHKETEIQTLKKTIEEQSAKRATVCIYIYIQLLNITECHYS